MKKLILILAAAAMAVPAMAGMQVYKDVQDIYCELDNIPWIGGPKSITWGHQIPYKNGCPNNNGSNHNNENANDFHKKIKDIKLTIICDDLDYGDSAKVMVKDKYGQWNMLGNLNTTKRYTLLSYKPGSGGWIKDNITYTHFDIDPHWLDSTMKVKARIGGGFLANVMEIEKSKLSVTMVPVPGSVLLGGIGLSVLGWAKKRKKIA